MFYWCSGTIKKQYCYEMNNGVVVKSVIICTDKKNKLNDQHLKGEIDHVY